LEQLPCAGRVVAGESCCSKCCEAPRRQVVLLAQELTTHRDRFTEPRFSLDEITAPARQLSQLVQRRGNLRVRRAVRSPYPIEYLAQKTPRVVVLSAVGQRA